MRLIQDKVCEVNRRKRSDFILYHCSVTNSTSLPPQHTHTHLVGTDVGLPWWHDIDVLHHKSSPSSRSFIETLPRYLFSTTANPPTRLTLSLIFRTKGQAQLKGQEPWTCLTFIFWVKLNVWVPAARWAHSVRCCITTAESGSMRARQEQMCWMGFMPGNKSQFYLNPFLRFFPLLSHCHPSKYISTDPMSWYWSHDSLPKCLLLQMVLVWSPPLW